MKEGDSLLDLATQKHFHISVYDVTAVMKYWHYFEVCFFMDCLLLMAFALFHGKKNNPHSHHMIFYVLLVVDVLMLAYLSRWGL